MSSTEIGKDEKGDEGEQTSALMVRQSVPSLDTYGDYRPYLREDFYFSCGYCTISECEAQGLAYEIDHYEPVSERPELKKQYDNLIYSCHECNSLKLDVSPPPAAREEGYAFYRPDHHLWDEHFEPSGFRVNSKSNVGEFTKEVLNLNRQSLRRLRELRQRLDTSAEYVASGIQALRRFKIDQLPPGIRARANQAISKMPGMADEAAMTVDDILKTGARSPLLDEDEDWPDAMAARAKHLHSAMAIFPGYWRGRHHKKEREAKKEQEGKKDK